jgi:hypothetical protein
VTRSDAVGPAAIATVIACLAGLVAAMLPWLRTGEARRSAFALARSVDALGFADTPLRRAMVISCYSLPLVTAATWMAAALRRVAVVAALGALLGAVSVGAGWVMVAAVRPEAGPIAAIVAGSAMLASAAWLSLTIRGASKADGAAERPDG